MAGIAGPLLLALLKESTGSYSMTLQIFAGLLLVSFLAAAGLKRYGKAEGLLGMQEEKA
jgi:OFA family oxalate/formate antiporter-like MFS transporter